MKLATDEEIIELCAKGDGAAFDAMMERFGMRLYRFLYSLTFDGGSFKYSLNEKTSWKDLSDQKDLALRIVNSGQ